MKVQITHGRARSGGRASKRIHRHVMAVRMNTGTMGGISAQRNCPNTVDELFDCYAKEADVTRVMVVDVDDDKIVVRRDVTFHERFAAPPENCPEECRANWLRWEAERVARLDNRDDWTVRDVLRDCTADPCEHEDVP